MIHHVSFGTNDISRARAFYDPVLNLLGLRLVQASDRAADYGTDDIMFSIESPVDGQPATAGNGVHVAFQARDRQMVQQFHALALAHGGTEDGAPGLRPEYDANYYAAFVRDPDGNKVEAMTFSAK